MTEKVNKDTEKKPVEAPAEKTEEKTVQDIIRDTVRPEKEKETETVPLATFLETKKDAKKFEKLFNDLQEKVNVGDSSNEEINDDLDALATEFDIDSKFVTKLSKVLEAKAEKKAGAIIKPILDREDKLSKKEKDELLNKAFEKAYNLEIEKSPEYKDIANAEVIKQLSFLPQNANKTFAQLIEETYGAAITGRHTIPDTNPGGGKDPEPIDFNKAKQDTKYFESIMANPILKAEYNKHLLAPRGRRS